MKQKYNLFRRSLSLFLSVLLLCGTLPVGSHAASSDSTLTVTVTDSKTGSPLMDAIVYIDILDGQHRAVNNNNGTYTFTKPDSTETTYDLHISCSGYYADVIDALPADTQTLAVALDPCEESNTWVTFGVFYTADGQLPTNGYCNPGSGHGDYGPTGNGESLVQVKVDISRLKSNYEDIVKHATNVKYSNGWWSSTTNNFEFCYNADTINLDDCRIFWTAVKECMEFESEQIFRNSGLFDVYIAYALKEEVSSSWTGTNTTQHLDGVLDVEPPVYVIELQAESAYFGGFITDTRTQNPDFPEFANVLQAYNDHLNQSIEWNKSSSSTPTYTGTFIQDKIQYTVQVKQTDYSSQNTYPDGSEIGYDAQSSDYYVATFNMTLSGSVQVQFTATYTDGLDYEYVFNDQVQTGSEGDKIAAFTGNTDREGYQFQGWTIQGGDGTLYTDAQVQNMTLEGQDIVFVASYAPKFTVTYNLNGGNGGPDSLTETHPQNATVNATTAQPEMTGYRFLGWKTETGTLLQPGAVLTDAITGNHTLTAQWEAITVTFYTNNTNSQSADIFRVYGPESDYKLNADGTIPAIFYDIPQFSYDTHNKYIFKGWYLKDGTPFNWTDAYTVPTEVYAHWIEATDVTQEAADNKQNIPNGIYGGFDLVGAQIRYAEKPSPDEYYDYGGGAGGGLRFICALSESVWQQIRSIRSENEAAAEYGLILAKTNTAINNNEANDSDYQLQYVGTNVNGVDTSAEYWYARNLKCSGLPLDHFNCADYRLFTTVVTYKSYTTEEALAQGHAISFLTRPYLRYYDANGLLRTHHGNYTEQTQVYSGCSASYSQVAAMTETVVAGG